MNEKSFSLINLLFLSLCGYSLQYCDISFPSPTEQFSTKFTLKTNSGNEKFTSVISYIPGKTYDIIVSVNNNQKKEKWSVEELYVKANAVPIDSETSRTSDYNDVGKLLFNFTGGSRLEQCADRFHVKFFYNLPEEITFYWTAPLNSRGCITLSVIGYFKNGNFNSAMEEQTHAICENRVNQQDTMQGDQPYESSCGLKDKADTAKMCNIGSTAIYRMTLENNWNHLNHWKDWPGREGYIPKLTQYIGASHSNNFDIYHLGGMASPAVQQLCTNGSYNTLQKLFYKSGNDILTVILARSLEATPTSSKRSALLVVNSTYHLVTFLSHLVPSPDWCTGLSRLDLCSGKCNWPDTLTMALYPWDAGVYGGESYLSGKEVEARSPICPITSTWPKDNPFTHINGKLQNIGIVTFKLIQEYNKDRNVFCNSDNVALQDEGYPLKGQVKVPNYNTQKVSDDKSNDCQMLEWNEWSKCSKTCGSGEKVRYRKPAKEGQDKCAKVLMKEVVKCYNKCPKQLTVDNCLLRLWAEWSPCNATCTQLGARYRERVFIDEEEKQQCLMYPEMKEMETCRQASSRCDPANICSEYVNAGEICDWSNPTMRYYFDSTIATCKAFTFKGCYGGLNNFINKHDCESMCKIYHQKMTQDRTRRPDENEHRCNARMNWGQDCKTRSPSYRWYFDNINQKCYRFYYAGCRGSANKFRSRRECEEHCLTKVEPLSYPTITRQQVCTYSQWSDWTNCATECPSTRTRTRSLEGPAVNCKEELTQIDKCDVLVCSASAVENESLKKCRYSPWSDWSPCSVYCGKGIRERVRRKLNHNCIPEFPQFSHRETCYNDC